MYNQDPFFLNFLLYRFKEKEKLKVQTSHRSSADRRWFSAGLFNPRVHFIGGTKKKYFPYRILVYDVRLLITIVFRGMKRKVLK